ncbi:division/cell wall cluster transcriptional repressor MraZ [Chitinibacter sp. GC72]|uniref:division/cell wall cluster transcriptional repressor MraZ n=1 Tax=Chitinibacter sp. GC72 TaxID=1526917 RepID=UPI0012FC25CA|nr:division/cell wall cluster transcriptional repressor MraZ [Chitinibacter sp. GC72]
MFSGVSSLNLDSKGRLAIPAKHRDTLLAQAQGKLIITADPAGCLLVYPETAWLPIRDQLNQLTGAKANIRRFIVGQAEEVEMDASGRVLVPPRLRQVAKLDKEVALVGMGNKFELWDDARWIATTEAIMGMDPQELENNMEGILL